MVSSSSRRPAAVCQHRPIQASRPRPNSLPCPPQHAKAFHPCHSYQVPARNHSNPPDTNSSLPQRQHLRGNQTKTQGTQSACEHVRLWVLLCVCEYNLTLSDWTVVSTVPPAVCSRTERHPVVSVCSHGQEGHSEPAGAGGAGDIEPGVVPGERVWRGGGLHGHLSLWRPRAHTEPELHSARLPNPLPPPPRL